LIHFFQRSSDDDHDAVVPAIEFLNSLRPKVAAEINAILDAVAKAPPPAFSGGESGKPCMTKWPVFMRCA
jgi:hypothetical protein